jgi:predicted RNase H-like nuclease (RuvC/YqgF family)
MFHYLMIGVFHDYRVFSNPLFPTNMPRETKITKVNRLTRSGRMDPLWATVVTLQERVKYLERQIHRGERSKADLEEEIRRLEEEVERLSSQRTTSQQLRELELENQNLRRQVARLGNLLVQLRIPIPAPLDRTFSSLDMA